MHHPAILWKQTETVIQCRACAHFCRIADGQRGQCGVRENSGGELRSLSYHAVAALNLDPIEKKPLFHYLPGTMTLSLGTPGCNLGCTFCQNANLSQPPRQGQAIRGESVSPADLVRMAQRSGARSLAYTYSEPTVFVELVRDTAEQACLQNLGNVLVSNGFQSTECLDTLGSLVQAANIDLKAFTERFYRDICGAKLQPVLKNLVHMQRLGWHVEVTTLVIPNENDSDQELTDIARFIHSDLGKDTPWHVSRFHPCHQMTDHAPTPLDTLKRAWDIGKAEGLNHVFVGNVPGSGLENTTCPGCGQIVMERSGFTVLRDRLDQGRCNKCDREIIRPPFVA